MRQTLFAVFALFIVYPALVAYGVASYAWCIARNIVLYSIFRAHCRWNRWRLRGQLKDWQ